MFSRYLLSVFAALLAVSAYASKARDPLTLDEAKKLLAATQTTSEFPLVMNDSVLVRLNRYVADAGRALTVKDALQRMQMLEPMLTSHLAKYDLPRELLAVPLVESQYENLPPPEVGGAGLWMFIKPTARDYGLTVNERLDERLDPKLATDAAMRLLSANQTRFKDWLLALAAYNQGGTTVSAAIDRAGTRDPWKLVELGYLNDYIAAVTAGAIVIRNPSLVE